jgi:hypothetical protein
MHISNAHVDITNKFTHKISTLLVQTNLYIPDNCTAAPYTPDQQGLPLRLQTSVFGWTIVAKAPGRCALQFTSYIPATKTFESEEVYIPIYDVFKPPEIAAILAAVIGGASLIIAAFVTRGGRS